MEHYRFIIIGLSLLLAACGAGNRRTVTQEENAATELEADTVRIQPRYAHGFSVSYRTDGIRLLHISDPQKEHATLYEGRTMIYAWSRTNNDVYARYFYLKNGAIGEDSGTGSAAANLGGLHCLNGTTSLEYRIRQGCKMGRENVLHLKVVEGEIWIGGQNTFMGQGELLWAE